MALSSIVALLTLLGCTGGLGGGGKKTTDDAPALAWTSVGRVRGLPTALVDTGDGLVAAIDDGLWESPDGRSWVEVKSDGLPDGRILWLAALPGQADLLLAYVDGHGLYRGDGDGWSIVPTPPTSTLLTSLNPRVGPVPFDLAGSPDRPDTAWMAATGGLYRTDDGGWTWTAVDLSEAGFNILFTSVAVQGDQVVATAYRPAGVLPDAYAGLLSAGVFYSDDGGEDWRALDPDQAVRWPTGSTIDPFGNVWLATMDQGVLKLGEEGWLEMGGPSDALDLAWVEGGMVAASARRGVWRLEDSRWTATGTDQPVVALTTSHAIGHDGSLWALEAGTGGAAPADGGATVHVALSMHVNLYHSYRGDTNDDDGYGIDLDVMRSTLDWLDAEPRLRADWDMDSHWSLDGEWMTVDGADVRSRIQARVADGLDDVRLMSWNNGAMSSHTRAEFDQSMARAWDSNRAAFDRVVAGVQPQECMFTPEHVGWYADQGIEWITLFNSATPFSALRSEVDLSSDTWTNPSRIETDDGALTVVPVYHHADLLDHGGLAGWVSQLHQAETDDQLLVVHFDADAESWQAFDEALAPLLELDYVEFTTIQDYLDDHPATVTIDTPFDIADGNGDGLQSWAGKDFNHRLAAGIVNARELAAQAAALAPEDDLVASLLDLAMTPRLLALSTTNFGLAAPLLHPDRVASAQGYVDEATSLAQDALDAAAQTRPLAPGTISVLNTRDSEGAALIELVLPVPDSTQAVVRDEAGDAMPITVQDGVVSLVLDLGAHQERVLSWDLSGQLVDAMPEAEALHDLPLATPFTECDRAQALGTLDQQGELTELGSVALRVDAYTLPLCDDQGSVQITRQAWVGLQGVVVAVAATMGQPADADLAESVALTPLVCDGAADSLSWQTHGGTIATRAARQGVRSWNGQAVDGWMALHCADGRTIQVSHRAQERSSLGLAPLRTSEDDAILAPLGTLWGPAPFGDARQTGGLGLAWHVSEAIGSQFRPQAPDWAGQDVRYRLLIGDGTVDEGTLDLFAHPPLVRIGELDDGS